MKRHNFFLPAEIVEALKAKAEAEGVTMAELIRQALQQYLDSLKQKAAE